MHLVSQKEQVVSLKTLSLKINFTKGETLLTEISRKFNLRQMEDYLGNQGLKTVQSWTDSQGWFGLILCQYQA